jgi:hypothetical protein
LCFRCVGLGALACVGDIVGLVPRRGLEVFLTFCVTTDSMHSKIRDGSDVSSSLLDFRKRLRGLTTDESGAESLAYDVFFSNLAPVESVAVRDEVRDDLVLLLESGKGTPPSAKLISETGAVVGVSSAGLDTYC